MWASTDELRSSGHNLGNKERRRVENRPEKQRTESSDGSPGTGEEGHVMLVERRAELEGFCYSSGPERTDYSQPEPYMIAFPQCVKGQKGFSHAIIFRAVTMQTIKFFFFKVLFVGMHSVLIGSSTHIQTLLQNISRAKRESSCFPFSLSHLEKKLNTCNVSHLQ